MKNMSHDKNLFNGFLFATATTIIKYLEHPTMDLYSSLRASCDSNDAYDCWRNPYNTAVKLEDWHREILEKTENFLYKLIFFSEYVGCECHNKSLEEYNAEVRNALKEYTSSLLALSDVNDFQTQLSSIGSEFIQDYDSILQRLQCNNITIKSAEHDLSIWQDVVPNSILENALISMKFAYITKLLTFPYHESINRIS